ncbi:MAG: hypothetical protein HUK19_00105 [Fibrobacter sp.]|nr:hypothetical protein [Fibrobacter sp.]
MRTFTFGEQALIGKLIANSADPVSCFPVKIIESVFQDNKVTFHAGDLAYFNFYVNEGKEDSVKEKVKTVYKRLLEAFNLVDYLKDQGMVTALVSTREKKTVFGEDVAYVSAGLVEVRVFVEENLVVEKMIDFMTNALFVSDSLKELQAEDFKTFEDKTLEESRKLVKKARNAVIIAFVAVLVAVGGIVFTALQNSNSQAPDPNVTLKPALESIQKSLDEKVVPAVVDLKTATSEVKNAIDNLGTKPVNLSELQKESDDSAASPEPSKKSKKRKRR